MTDDEMIFGEKLAISKIWGVVFLRRRGFEPHSRPDVGWHLRAILGIQDFFFRPYMPPYGSVSARVAS